MKQLHLEGISTAPTATDQVCRFLGSARAGYLNHTDVLKRDRTGLWLPDGALGGAGYGCLAQAPRLRTSTIQPDRSGALVIALAGVCSQSGSAGWDYVLYRQNETLGSWQEALRLPDLATSTNVQLAAAEPALDAETEQEASLLVLQSSTDCVDLDCTTTAVLHLVGQSEVLVSSDTLDFAGSGTAALSKTYAVLVRFLGASVILLYIRDSCS